jgi:hypothetical protein
MPRGDRRPVRARRGKHLPVRGPLAALTIVAALAALAPAPASAAAAPVARVDGISDQSLAAWEGDFHSSALARLLRPTLVDGAPAGQLAFARYVVQWDALLTGGHGAAGAAGDYATRFDAWLRDAGSLGLAPVVALTSYDGAYPVSVFDYSAGLRSVLARAAALGHPIAYIEPWNEPNGQGAIPAATAAAYADAAVAVCAGPPRCTPIAGDFADRDDAPAYAREYVRALAVSPADWGVHPYAAVAEHDLAPLLALLQALPPAAGGRRLWITEVAALVCRRGEVFGEARQAQDAAFLVERLLADSALAPVHTFYYGLQFRDGAQAPCTPAGGEDGELFGPGGAPRPAAAVVFPQLAEGRAAEFGPGPG